MRTVTQVLQEIDNEPNEYDRSQILRKYCEEIIEECVKESDVRSGKIVTVDPEAIRKVKKLL